MARLVLAKCPNCGGGMQLPNSGDWATCSYCGISSFVQRRGTTTTHAVPPGAPVVHAPSAGVAPGLIIAIVLSSFVALATSAAFALRASGGASIPGLRSLDVTALRQLVYTGRVFFGDANGDGVDDVLTLAIYVGDDKQHLRALHATSGETLWATEKRLAGEETVFVVPGALLVLHGAKAVALDPKTGTELYKAALPERAELVCRVGDRVLLLTKDEKLHSIGQRGELSAVGSPESLGLKPGHPACPPVQGSSHYENGPLVRAPRNLDIKVEGMSIDDVLEYADGPPQLLVGQRSVGSGVPMLAVHAGRQLLWRADVPAKDPLAADEDEPLAAVLTKDRVIAAYALADGTALHVLCFALTDGRRLWDVTFPTGSKPSFFHLATSDRHVALLLERTIHNLNIADGSVVFRAGP